jgi:hypothetical protein
MLWVHGHPTPAFQPDPIMDLDGRQPPVAGIHDVGDADDLGAFNDPGSLCGMNEPDPVSSTQAHVPLVMGSEKARREAEGLFAGMTLLEELEPLPPVDVEEHQNPGSEVLTVAEVVQWFLKRVEICSPSPTTYLTWRDSWGDSCPGDAAGLRQLFISFVENTPEINGKSFGFSKDDKEKIADEFLDQSVFESLSNLLDQKKRGKTLALAIDMYIDSLRWNEKRTSLICPSMSCRSSKRSELKFDDVIIARHFDRYHSRFIDDQRRLTRRQMVELALKGLPIDRESCIPYLPELQGPQQPRDALNGGRCRVVGFEDEISSEATQAQVRTLRRLRIRVIIYHRQLLRHCVQGMRYQQRRPPSDHPELWSHWYKNSELVSKLKLLLESFKSHRTFLDTGLQAFREILLGRDPPSSLQHVYGCTSLQDVLGFTCLIRAMKETMEAEQCDAKFSVTKEELQHWRSHMDIDDQTAFDDIAMDIFPDWWEILNNVTTPRIFSHSNVWYPSNWYDLPMEKLPSLIPYESPPASPFMEPLERLFETASHLPSFDFSAWIEMSEYRYAYPSAFNHPVAALKAQRSPSPLNHDQGSRGTTRHPGDDDPKQNPLENAEAEAEAEGWTLVAIAVYFLICTSMTIYVHYLPSSQFMPIY